MGKSQGALPILLKASPDIWKLLFGLFCVSSVLLLCSVSNYKHLTSFLLFRLKSLQLLYP